MGSKMELNSRQIQENLGLQKHIEGGYYNVIYGGNCEIDTPHGKRQAANSIHYMLDKESPIGYWHINRNDILHYYNLGSPLLYRTISPEGEYEEHIIGPDVKNGHKIFLMVPGGYWKSTELMEGEKDFSLISEVVTPGFDWADERLGPKQELSKTFPKLDAQLFTKYCKE